MPEEEREERDRDSTGTLNRQHECVKASTSGTVGITESLTGLFSFSHTWLSSMTLSCGGNRAASSSSCDGPCKGGPAWKFDEEVGECESCGYARGLCASCGTPFSSSRIPSAGLSSALSCAATTAAVVDVSSATHARSGDSLWSTSGSPPPPPIPVALPPSLHSTGHAAATNDARTVARAFR